MSSDECDRHAAGALDQYFAELREALGDARPDVDAAELEAEWRDLYELAEADFVRFLRGWAPGGDHKKLHDYADRVTDRVLRRLL